MKKYLGWATSVILLAGCAAPLPKPSELGAGAKTVAFIQHGTEPNKYVVGAVDGKTSWAGGGAPTFTPGSSASIDVGAAAAANIVFAVGQKIAAEAMKDDPEYYIRLLRTMVGERKMTNEVAPRVLPELAASWGFTYNTAQTSVVPNGTPLIDAQGNFNGKDPGTDLVLSYGIEQLMLSEKPTLSVLWKAVGTAGMYDRPVVPYIVGSMTAFKRNDKGELKQVWNARCPDLDFLNAPVSEQFVVLRENPEKAAPVFDAAVPLAAASCKTVLKRLNGV